MAMAMAMAMSNKKTIALDFDGVVHKYSKGYHDSTIYDEPMEGAIESMKTLQTQGYVLVIHTARKDLEGIAVWMNYWWYEKLGTMIGLDKIDITSTKPIATAYIDDNGIRFTNWNDITNYFL